MNSRIFTSKLGTWSRRKSKSKFSMKTTPSCFSNTFSILLLCIFLSSEVVEAETLLEEMTQLCYFTKKIKLK